MTYRAISDYFLKLNVAFFSHWQLEAHIPLHCHLEYWWGHSHLCSHQPKYWWGYVPGIPGGVDAYGVQVKLWDPLRTRSMPERFCGGVSLRRGAISSVCTFTLRIAWRGNYQHMLIGGWSFLKTQNTRTDMLHQDCLYLLSACKRMYVVSLVMTVWRYWASCRVFSIQSQWDRQNE